MKPINHLEVIEKLCALANPDETNKVLNEIYIVAHSGNIDNECYSSHQNWRDEAAIKAKQLKDI